MHCPWQNVLPRFDCSCSSPMPAVVLPKVCFVMIGSPAVGLAPLPVCWLRLPLLICEAELLIDGVVESVTASLKPTALCARTENV